MRNTSQGTFMPSDKDGRRTISVSRQRWANLPESLRIPNGSFRSKSTERPNREAKGPAITLPNGSTVPRLPGYSMWMWDGQFCGSVGFRWQPGTTELPPYCLGHVGYSVVPWKRRRGYATRALHLLLPHARAEGLAHIELTTDVDNVASRRVIEANGGVLVERFHKPQGHGGAESLRFRIALADTGA